MVEGEFPNLIALLTGEEVGPQIKWFANTTIYVFAL